MTSTVFTGYPGTRREYEAMLDGLLGRRIEAVTYAELAYEGGAAMWDQTSPHFDSLDFGLTWSLDDGSQFTFTWGWEFVNYGVSIRHGSPEPLDAESARNWSVSDRWAPWRSRVICEVESVWIPSELGERATSYPQQIRVGFEGASTITISACELRGDDPPLFMMDHITVFFREQDVPSWT